MDNVLMAGVLVQIRDVDPYVRDRLKALAAERGMSLNRYLKSVLAEAGHRPTRAEVIQRLRQRGSLISSSEGPSTVEMIRQMREERDRELDERFSVRHPELGQ